MNSAELTQPLTARLFLSEDTQGADITELIAQSLRERGIADSALEGVRRLSTSALQAVDHEVATVTGEFLDLDLGSLLVAGWRKYKQLTDAARRTLAEPNTEEVVVLAAHRVSSTHHPSIEVLVDGTKVYTVMFELTVEFDLTGIVAVVRRGELTALRSGKCVITVTLTLEDVPVIPAQQRRVDLHLVVPLNPTLALLPGPTDRAP